MPRTALVVQAIQKNNGAQLVNAGADQANGNSFVNDGATTLVIQNGDASPRTLTVHSVSCSHGRTGDLSIVIAASAQCKVQSLEKGLFNQADGTVQLDWSAGTTSAVKITAVQAT